QTWEFEFWPRLQWVGIAFLPSVYFQFSDALLATTGRPSRWRRRFVVRLVYVASILFTLSLLLNIFSGPVISFTGPAPHLQSTLVTDVFVFFYIGVMALAWVNFIRAYRRTTTNTSRRRMAYLITGAIAPAAPAFPFLPYSPGCAANHLL
ncbi:MAG TPA: histidine kinase N-terminal 7TM domain-containing protein, partial [Anaerolinea sp.]|nr:histidine kinase N-terminal 7TM domain-containing protein [Anaerolinea sp.]